MNKKWHGKRIQRAIDEAKAKAKPGKKGGKKGGKKKDDLGMSLTYDLSGSEWTCHIIRFIGKQAFKTGSCGELNGTPMNDLVPKTRGSPCR